jgi:hypothetical protein
MKNTFYLIVSIILLTSCEKEDNNAINKKFLIGNWQKIEIDLSIYCIDYLEFNNESLRLKKICSSSAQTGFFQEYELIDNKIVVDGNVWYEIEYLSQDLLKLYDSNGRLSEYKKP